MLVHRHEITGVALAWDRWGPDTGVPLVLLHGFSGSAHDFALSIDRLAQDRPVIALDHRGHGSSSKLGRVEGYSLAQLAKDFVSFASTNIDGPFDVVGHSMGGRVALTTALNYPDMVRSLVLMDTTAWAFVSLDNPMSQVMGALLEAMNPADGQADLSGFRRPEDPLIQEATPADWQDIKAKQSAAFDPFAMKALGLELFSPELPSLRDRLGEVRCPTTVLCGNLDEPYIHHAPELAELIPDAKLALIDGAYHSPQLTHQEQWHEIIEDHLRRAAT